MEGEIEFIGAFDTDKDVVLTPNMGRTTYDITIANYHAGRVVKYYNGWMVRFVHEDRYTLEDEDAILERLEIPNTERRYTKYEFFPDTETK